MNYGYFVTCSSNTNIALLNSIANWLQRRTSAIPPPNHQAPSSNSQAVSGSGYGAVPNNARSLLLQEHRNVARARQEKGTSGSRVQPVPEGKIVVSISTPQQTYETSAMLLAARTNSGVAYKYPSPHREEECPTCLEGMG